MTLEPRRLRSAVGALAAPGLLVLIAAAVVGAASAAARQPAGPVRAQVEKGEARSAWGPACGDDYGSSVDFSGSDEDGGRFVLRQRLGEGRSLCARVEGVSLDPKDGSIRDLRPGGSVDVETRAGRRSQRMRVTPGASGARYEWAVDGEARPVDDGARAWLADALQVVAACREIGRLQGQVGELQGRIGEVQGEIGRLQGEIGRVQGHIGSLQGRIGQVQGEEGSLQGEIGRHAGAIGGLEAARSQASADLRTRIDQEIEGHRAEIRKLQAQLDGGDLARRKTTAEAELRQAEAASRTEIAELERKIAGVKGEQRIADLERQIRDIHADERIREIETRLKPAVERLNRTAARLAS
jgi:predicted  nucleic acid-binding Zn-ribbon protein